MKRSMWGIALVAGIVIAVMTAQTYAASSCSSSDAFCFEASAGTTPKLIERVTVPEIAVPLWMEPSE